MELLAQEEPGQDDGDGAEERGEDANDGYLLGGVTDGEGDKKGILMLRNRLRRHFTELAEDMVEDDELSEG